MYILQMVPSLTDQSMVRFPEGRTDIFKENLYVL